MKERVCSLALGVFCSLIFSLVAPAQTAVVNRLAKYSPGINKTPTGRSAISPQKSKDAQDYFNEGFAYMQANKYTEAIEPLKQVIRLKPDDDSAFWLVGIAYLKLARYSEAVAALKEATRLNPSNAFPRGILGQAYLAQGRNQDAVDAYTEALRLDPNDKRWRDGLKHAEDALNGPPEEIIKQQAEGSWRSVMRRRSQKPVTSVSSIRALLLNDWKKDRQARTRRPVPQT